ncbi:MAG: biotin--[acetyl-CoA-carboxylase] ligase [Betaproteobacteria bacterium]
MPDTGGLERALAARGAPLPARLEWHESLVSTNDRLKELARDGAPEWTVVLADVQTGGRGRAGRGWASPAGGLYLSLLLRPRFTHVGVLPLAAGLAVADAAAEHGAEAFLKWPNDVLLGERKLAGVLAEAASSAAGVDWVVLGVGVNVSVPPRAFPAELREAVASLADVGPAPEVAALAAAVLDRLRVWYHAAASSRAAVVAAWRQRAVAWWGEPVEIRTGGETLRGRLLDVDDEGALLVATGAGRARRVLSAEVVRLRRAV